MQKLPDGRGPVRCEQEWRKGYLLLLQVRGPLECPARASLRALEYPSTMVQQVYVGVQSTYLIRHYGWLETSIDNLNDFGFTCKHFTHSVLIDQPMPATPGP